MAQKHTLEELNNCSREELITIVLMMQGQLDALMITSKNSLSRSALPIIIDLAGIQRA